MYIEIDKSKPRDVVSLGRATIDLYANEIGPLENALTLSKYVGGSTANTSIAMARLGLQVGYIGKVSEDQFGNYIISTMKSEGIDTSHIRRAALGVRSGITIGEILPDRCNCFMYRKECADLYIQPSEIDAEYIKNYKVLLISGTSLSHSPAREAVFLAIDTAHRLNTKVVLDLDYREGTWDTPEEASIYYTLAAEKCDIVVGTRDEFNVMQKCFHPNNEDNNKNAEWLIAAGVKLVVIKNGKEGSFIFVNNHSYKGGIYPTKVLKSFGAGDSYLSAFLFGLIHDLPMEDMLKYCAAASSITITGHSCSDAMPTLQQVQLYMTSHEYRE